MTFDKKTEGPPNYDAIVQTGPPLRSPSNSGVPAFALDPAAATAILFQAQTQLELHREWHRWEQERRSSLLRTAAVIAAAVSAAASCCIAAHSAGLLGPGRPALSVPITSTAAPAPSAPLQGGRRQGEFVLVQEGDTICGLAKRHGRNADAILQENSLPLIQKNGFWIAPISPGQTLQLPDVGARSQHRITCG